MAAFIYTVSAALRLARFNTKVGVGDKRYFQGLPSPSAAAILAAFVWMLDWWEISGDEVPVLALVLTVTSGLLMVSNFSYYSFKEVGFKNRVPFFILLLVVFVFVVMSLNPPTVLFAGFAVYAVSGPVLSLRRWRRKRSSS